jgi:hypothetical protein
MQTEPNLLTFNRLYKKSCNSTPQTINNKINSIGSIFDNVLNMFVNYILDPLSISNTTPIGAINCITTKFCSWLSVLVHMGATFQHSQKYLEWACIADVPKIVAEYAKYEKDNLNLNYAYALELANLHHSTQCANIITFIIQ